MCIRDRHVGNWPGKTVEKKEGTHVSEGVEMRIVDLPGTYLSLIHI